MEFPPPPPLPPEVNTLLRSVCGCFTERCINTPELHKTRCRQCSFRLYILSRVMLLRMWRNHCQRRRLIQQLLSSAPIQIAAHTELIEQIVQFI